MIIDGKKTAQKILKELKLQVEKLPDKPGIAVVIVGENPASKIYVNIKHKRAQELGMHSIIINMPEDTTQQALESKIDELNNDPSINAILVQMPLPPHLDTYRIIEKIAPEKDVDGFSPQNVGRLSIGLPPYAYPCTPKGIMRLLDEYRVELEGKKVVVIGRSNIVGKPIAAMLLARNATVIKTHSKTKDIQSITQDADIIISAVGVAKMVKADWIKNGAIIVDVGITRHNDKLCGDVDFEDVKQKASLITPVPGGVGPMTIAMLMENTLSLYNLQKANLK